MAEYKFTAALNVSDVPPVTRFQPRPVLMGQLDNRLRDPSNPPNTTLANNPQNLPSITYMQNVMPTQDGVQSVGFEAAIAAFPGAGTGDDVFILRDVDESVFYFCPAQGRNYVATSLAGPWVSVNPLAAVPNNATVTVAYVNGETYILYANSVLLLWDSTGPAFTDKSATLSGFVIAELRAICGSGNYMVALTYNNEFAWSSLTDPLDFVVSATTGAGRQVPVDIRGACLFLSSVAGGVIVHTLGNAVAAVYTQNSAAPWIFREIKNSGGCSSIQLITRESSNGQVVIYGTNGLQQLDLRDAINIHVAVSDFFGFGVLETFNSATNLLSISRGNNINVKLAFLAGRYICCSYGTVAGTYTQSLIYDATLKRWGKLVVDHADIFAAAGYFNPKNGLYILKTDGVVQLITLDYRVAADSAVLILGRYQINRTHQICSQELELEVLDASDSATVHVASNYNGTTVGEVAQMTAYAASDNYRSYQKQLEGENLSYIIKGSFGLSTALITATLGARM